MKKSLLFVVLLSFLLSESFSQTIMVGSYAETIARRNQLLGISDSLSSFCVRPINSDVNTGDEFWLHKLIASKNLLPDFKLGFPLEIKILPLNWVNQVTPIYPVGYNNGSLYPNNGYQTQFSGGVFVKAGILNFQFRPEIVHAQNRQFSTFPIIWYNTNNQQLLSAYFNLVNSIDAPERFGTNPITHFYPGQSKLTLIYKNIEVGGSTENLWWGPGVQNSIMMSNSAPGFLHWTFNSAAPVKTPIGSFEWQIVGGQLQQSGYGPANVEVLENANGAYQPKPLVNRYLSAFTFNWQPKPLPGLFVGASGYDYLNKDSVYRSQPFLRKYFTVLFNSSEQANTVANGDGQDFAYSLYIREVLSKYHAEIYAEFARNDRASSLTDFLTELEHSTGYTWGFSKMFLLRRNQLLHLTMETTHLESPPTYLVRASPTWYIHPTDPRDGYTNQGRYLGAGIGPGSNSFYTDMSYINGRNTFGVSFERYVHDNDLYYEAYENTGTFDANWVDLILTGHANILALNRFLITAKATHVWSLHHEYYVTQIASQNTTVYDAYTINLSYCF